MVWEGERGAECPDHSPTASPSRLGGGGSSRLAKSAKDTVVYLRSNKRNTSLPNSARSAFFTLQPCRQLCKCLFSPVWACAQQENGSVQAFFCSEGCDLVWVIFMRRVLSAVIKYELPTTNTLRVRLTRWKPGRRPCSCCFYGAFVSFCVESQGHWNSTLYNQRKKMRHTQRQKWK